jgi:hypothetical protein
MGAWRFYKSRALFHAPPGLWARPAVRDATRRCGDAPCDVGNHAMAANTGIKSFVFLGFTSWCVRSPPLGVLQTSHLRATRFSHWTVQLLH